MDQRRVIGLGMVAVAVALFVVAGLLWSKADADAENANEKYELRVAVAGICDQCVEPDYTGSIWVAAIGGLILLGGIILVASVPVTDPRAALDP